MTEQLVAPVPPSCKFIDVFITSGIFPEDGPAV